MSDDDINSRRRRRSPNPSTSLPKKKRRRISSIKSIEKSGQQSIKARTVQNSANATSIRRIFTGSLVDKEKKKKIDSKTREALDTLNAILFTKIECYARPIAELGQHNASNDNDDDYKNNAKKASNGWHHALLVLTDNNNTRYLCDRQEGVRFWKIKKHELNELNNGHLKIILTKDIKLRYRDFDVFVENEIKYSYNMVSNNCIHFAYKFINDILKINWWSTVDEFWKFIEQQFDINDIKNGLYDEQQNEYQKKDISPPSNNNNNNNNNKSYFNTSSIMSCVGKPYDQFNECFQERANNDQIPALNAELIYQIYLWRASTLKGAHWSIVIGCNERNYTGFITLELRYDGKKQLVYPFTVLISRKEEKEKKYILTSKWEQIKTGSKWKWEIKTTMSCICNFTLALIKNHGAYQSIANSCQDFSVSFINECARFCNTSPPQISDSVKGFINLTSGMIGGILGGVIGTAVGGPGLGTASGAAVGASSFGACSNSSIYIATECNKNNGKKERIIPTINITHSQCVQHRVIQHTVGDAMVVKDCSEYNEAENYWKSLAWDKACCWFIWSQEKQTWNTHKLYGVSSVTKKIIDYNNKTNN